MSRVAREVLNAFLALALLARPAAAICYGVFCFPDPPPPESGIVMGNFWWVGNSSGLICNTTTSVESCMAECRTRRGQDSRNPASCSAFTWRPQDRQCEYASSCTLYLIDGLTGTEQPENPADMSGTVANHSKVCGQQDYGVVLSNDHSVINSGVGNCLYATNASLCCDLCGADPTCAGWQFSAFAGLECEESDAECQSFQEAPDACSSNSCTLYRAFYRIDTGTAAGGYGLISGAFLGRRNPLQALEPPPVVDPNQEQGQRAQVAFDFEDNVGTAVNGRCEFFAESEQECVQACNAQRYAASAEWQSIGGCQAYSFRTTNSSECFGAEWPKAGECVMYRSIGVTRALAEGDGQLAYGVIDPSVIPVPSPPPPSPSPPPESKSKSLHLSLVFDGPKCFTFTKVYLTPLRKAMAKLTASQLKSVAVTCFEERIPGFTVQKAPGRRRLTLTVRWGPYLGSDAQLVLRTVQAAVGPGSRVQTKALLAQVLPPAVFKLVDLSQPDEVVCTDQEGRSC